MRLTRATVLITILVLFAPQLALATMTFDQLDDDTFIVSHRVKLYGSRGKAMKLVYEKSASLCVAAGYTYLKIMDQESAAGQQYESANASARVRFYFEDGEDRVDCMVKASEKYIGQAKLKLDKMGYQQPDMVATSTEEGEAEGYNHTGTCSIEQIATMVEAGLTAAQIKAACKDE